MTESLLAQHATAIVDNCPFPLLLLDSDGCVIGCNRRLRAMVGESGARRLAGQSLSTLTDDPLSALLSGSRQTRWTDPAGRVWQFEVHRSEVPQCDGAEMRFFVDIGRRPEPQHGRAAPAGERERHNLTDPLTGLLNRRGILLALEPQVARSRRYNNPMAVVVMDVDAVRDRDNVLRQAAQLLRDQLRWADLVGSSAAGEFILVLPETTPEAALQLSLKLESRLRDCHGETHDGAGLRVCSGVTGWRRNDSAASLIDRAALALSQARTAGNELPVAL